MKNQHSLLLMPFAFAVACASTAPAPQPAPPAPSAAVPAPHASTALDSAEYRQALEDAYAQIVARENKPVNAPQVDVEAAVSMPIPDHRAVRGAVNLFSTDLKSNVQTYLLRSARYKKLIEKALGEQGLPKGLAYLPVIESGYSPTLTSRAGAYGIWQFMPDTAREYGLRVDWWVDERADPERSTKAAAVYIKDLYRQFNDWPLTLAAYNAGPGRIRRALDDSRATTFWELCDNGAIPKETRGYVPTFFATLIIASDPATYGFKLNPPYENDERRIELEGPLSLRYVAETASLDESLLKELNPSLRRGVLPPGRWPVRVPAKAAGVLEARASTLKNEDANIAICSFTLRSGDSIKKLARALGTKPEVILAMNDLRSIDEAGHGDSLYLRTPPTSTWPCTRATRSTPSPRSTT